MLFDIGGDGEDGRDRSRHIRASREVLADVVNRPEDLRALCDIGFPQRPFYLAPVLVADGCAVEAGRPIVDLDDEVVIIEEEFGNILLFGAVQGWYLFLGLDDGTVHAIPDELELFDGDLRPVHTDLSSLRHLLELLHRRVLKVDREWTGGDQSAPYAELDRFADGIQAEFARVDPVAFSEEESRESPWVYFFGDLRGGLYGTYYSRPGRA
ncbi:SUKH-4 family immunity protein [Streptomyces sp. NPDC050529]|uniref:SUKH-4 family immunity protein n=1 Tax=unclassified Streptomyces TaxID=2593676 RepID=UPI002DD8C57E|nr:SUKH-4 family immunity protein [Streptomyces sp. NBC_01022]WRZ82777.1 SUKH-4 family immunity protein [Streptomyces sp. NBC_01022]